MPEFCIVLSKTCPAVHRVQSCSSRTWRLSTLEPLAASNIRSRALQPEVKLQSQCLQLERLKNTNSLLQKRLLELRQKLNQQRDKFKKETEKAMDKLSIDFGALGYIPKELAARRNIEQEKSTNLLK